MSRQIDFSEYKIVDQENGNLVVEHEDGTKYTVSKDGILGADEIDTGVINNTHQVSSVSELVDAIGSYPHIALKDDFTWSAGYKQIDAGSSDVKIDGRGNTITRADGQDTRLLKITTTGDVEISNLKIDGNRQGQTTKSGLKEIEIYDANSLYSQNVTVVNNTGWCWTVDNVSQCQWDSPRCETGSTTETGLDGIHTRDCPRVTINNPQMSTGDDCIAVEANSKNISKISISGGELDSTPSTSGSGVKLFINSAAPAGTTISNATINTVVSGAQESGVKLQDDTSSGVFEDISISGAYSSTTSTIDAQSGGASTGIAISGRVYSEDKAGVFLSGWSDVSIEGSVDGETIAASISSCTDVTLSGTFRQNAEVADGYAAVNVNGTTHAYITGTIIPDNDGVKGDTNTDEIHGEAHVYGFSGVATSSLGANSTFTST